MSTIPTRLLAGAAAGFAATAPMTAVMEGLHPALPPEDQHPLPPRHITMRTAEKTAGVGEEDAPEPPKQAATLLAHFGYGSAAGAVYGLVEEHLPLPPALRGAAYGLAVWAGSYMGLLPALGLYPHAKDESAERNALMIAAHVVWGATLGVLTDMTTRGPGRGRAGDGRPQTGEAASWPRDMTPRS